MRFLLHLTTESRLANIMKEGLVPTKEYIKGVFMVNPKNLKNWSKNSVTSDTLEKKNLLEALLSQVSKGEDKLVALKIDTRNLPKGMRIREQKLVLTDKVTTRNFRRNNVSKEQIKEFLHQNPDMDEEVAIGVLGVKAGMRYLRNGLDARYDRLLQGKGKAIEYIYPETIPPECIQVAGKANLADNSVKDVLQELLGYTNENPALLHFVS